MTATTAPQVRDLVPQELPWLATAEVEIFGASAWSADLLRHDYYYGRNSYRVLLVGNQKAAYAVWSLEGDWFHLMNLAVLPQYRRRGLGRLLLEDFLQHGRATPATAYALEVSAANTAAISLYTEYGFTLVRRRIGYYQPENEDALVLQKPKEQE